MSNLIPVSEIQVMAIAMAKSGLFGMKSPDQALALMLIAQAEGMHPAIAARDYHVIQGRPALKADAMLARFQQAGGKVEWLDYSDAKVSARFSHAQGGSAVITWTLEQAKSAGLTGKDVWKQYPRQMLRARVISEGVKTIYPGVAVGVYTPEEIQDFDEKPQTRFVESKVAATPPVAVVEAAPETAIPVVDSHSHSEAALISKQADASMKKPFFVRISKSGWVKDQLKQYAQAKFGEADATKLTLAQLMIMAQTVSEQSFEQAMAAGMASEGETDGNFDSA